MLHPPSASWRNAGVALALLLIVGLPTRVWAKDDVQEWTTLEVIKRLTKTVDLFVRPEIRINDGISRLFYHEFRQGIRWMPSPHLGLGLNYLFGRNASSGKPLDEHTAELDVTPKTKWGPWDLSVRGRVAMRTIERSAGEQEWQLRAMPKIAYATKFAGHAIAPYVADDLFYDYTRKAFNQNRFFLGLGVPLSAPNGVSLKADLYYMLQTQLGARHDRNDNHILGAACTVRFD